MISIGHQRAIAILDILTARKWANDIENLVQQARGAIADGSQNLLSDAACAAEALAEAVVVAGLGDGSSRRPGRDYAAVKAVECAVLVLLREEEAPADFGAPNSDEAIIARLLNGSPLYWAKRATA